MQLYLCKALNSKGQIVEKKIFSAIDSDFLEIFKKTGLVFISKKKQKSSIRKPILQFTIPFLKNLMQLVKNRINLINALDIITTSFKDDESKLIVKSIKDYIKSGRSLSKSLAKFEQFFDKLTIKTIEISEKTAELAESLSRVVNYLESSIKLKNKIKDSLRYPIILFFCIALVFSFWLLVLVPKFAELFSEMDIQLPLISRIIIKLNHFLTDNLVEISGVILILLLFLWQQISNKKEKLLSKIPIVSTMKREVFVFKFFTAMEIMIQEKINLIEALECLKDENPKVPAIIKSIKGGNTLSNAISKTGLFNNHEISIVETGEQSGDLWPAFKTAADITKQNIEKRSQEIISMIQPIAIGSMGILLIIIVYSLITPLYSNLDLCF